MIKYALQCGKSHGFESWFRDSQSYDDQESSGLVTCPVCGSTDVKKAMMRPALRGIRTVGSVIEEPTAEVARVPETPEPVALGDERMQKMRAMMRQFRDHVLQHSHDVGPAFAAEARKIHEGASEKTAIRGEASPEDVRALIDDGIDIMPLPVFPDDRN